MKAELLFGAFRSADPARSRSVFEDFFGHYESLPFDDNAAFQYGILRARLSAAGTPIGPNDLLIAAIALANNLTLVTHNTREFSLVPGPSLEDWED